jgi:hypothetical protein
MIVLGKAQPELRVPMKQKINAYHRKSQRHHVQLHPPPRPPPPPHHLPMQKLRMWGKGCDCRLPHTSRKRFTHAHAPLHSHPFQHPNSCTSRLRMAKDLGNTVTCGRVTGGRGGRLANGKKRMSD